MSLLAGSDSIAEYATYAMKVVAQGKDQPYDLSEANENTKRIELRRVQKERRLFFLAMEMSFDGIIMGDALGNIVYVNNAATEMFAGQRKDFVRKNVIEFVVPSEKQLALELSLHAMKTGEGYTQQFTVQKVNGSEIVVEVTAAVIKDNGESIGFIDIIRDVTERKKAEESLKRHAALIDLSPSAIITKDSKGKVTFWSYGAQKLYGYSKEEALGKNISELLKANYPQSAEEIISVLQQKKNWMGEVTHHTKEGQRIVVQADWVAILDDKGKIAEILESNVDITGLKRAEEKVLAEAEERYLKAERWAAIGQLAGMVGHDLRNPLAGIKNAVFVLKKRQDSLGEVGLSMLDTIDQAVEHADRIINDMLDYSRELHLQIEETSTDSLVAYALLSVKAPSAVRVIKKVEDYPLRVDTTKIERVFINLIKNAFEAMPEGGQLTISCTKKGNSVDFVFADTGEGMSDMTTSKIFTPLFTTKAQGMGLGLAICKRLVEAHNGTITVESIVREGTVFRVSLPIK